MSLAASAQAAGVRVRNMQKPGETFSLHCDTALRNERCLRSTNLNNSRWLGGRRDMFANICPVWALWRLWRIRGVGTCEQSMIQAAYLAISLRLRSSGCRTWEGCAAPGLGEVSEPELSVGLRISPALPLSCALPAAVHWVPGLISHKRELKE